MNTIARIAITAAMLSATVALVPDAHSDGLGDHVIFGRVGALSTDRHGMTFEGDTRSVITVVGDGRTDLDCEVLDVNGRTIAIDLDPGSNCRLVIDAEWDTTGTLVVGNWGRVSSNYMATIY